MHAILREAPDGPRIDDPAHPDNRRMPRLTGLLATSLLLVGLSACTDTSGEEAAGEPCVGTFTYGNGTPAPPHMYQWTVDLREDGATVEFAASSRGPEEPPTWETDVEYAGDLGSFCGELVALAEQEPLGKVGGPTVHWETTTSHGYSDDSDTFAPALTALDELIGADTIPALKQQYVEWRDAGE